MKTIKNATEVVRKKDEEAEVMVEKHGWKYCPKSAYKAVHGKKSVQSTPKTKKAEKGSDAEEPAVKQGRSGSAAAEAKYREKKAQRN